MINAGSIMYFCNPYGWDTSIYSCIVTDDIMYTSNKPVRKVRITKNLSHDQCYRKETWVLESDLFYTLNDLKIELERRSKTRSNIYKSLINNVEDLVKFALNHELCGEDLDYEAVSAYKDRATELLNIKWE